MRNTDSSPASAWGERIDNINKMCSNLAAEATKTCGSAWVDCYLGNCIVINRGQVLRAQTSIAANQIRTQIGLLLKKSSVRVIDPKEPDGFDPQKTASLGAWSKPRIEKADELINSDIGRRAANEGWIIALHDYCRERCDIPRTEADINKCRSDTALLEAKLLEQDVSEEYRHMVEARRRKQQRLMNLAMGVKG